ncbi:hypothetical protein KXX28_007133 [Aspergillus fumigatus]|nr:hypothetical protein KXX28_007133 [Aspergillus fumigatus]
MPSRHESSARADYVPALCTHRPSLLPIEWLGEAFGLAQGSWQRLPRAGKLVKPGHLEEVDHYRVRALWVQPPTRVYRTLLLRRARRFDGRRGGLAPPGPRPPKTPT